MEVETALGRGLLGAFVVVLISGVIGIPLRYMHSPVEMVDLRDVEATIRLLAAFAARLSPDTDLSR